MSVVCVANQRHRTDPSESTDVALLFPDEVRLTVELEATKTNMRQW